MAKSKEVQAIEKNLEQFLNSTNPAYADLKLIAETYEKGDEEKKELIIAHYKRNGSLLINAVFNNDVDTLEELTKEPE